MLGKIFRKILGINEIDESVHYEIQPIVINPDLIVADLESIKESPVIQTELLAAKKLYQK